MLKPISTLDFEPVKAAELGLRGRAVQMRWIDIALLRVDTRYQRNILKGGKSNTRQIAKRFSWRKFTPVVVCEIEGGLFSIIDGQHRTTAARLIGLTEVPCAIVEAPTVEEQADSFKSINANITRVTPQDLYFADLAAKVDYTKDINEFCEKAGINIIRPGKKPEPGDCASVAIVKQCLRDFGSDLSIQAFKMVVNTPKSAGMLKPILIKALCKLLKANPDWQNNPKVQAALDDINLRIEITRAWSTVTQYNTPKETILIGNLYKLIKNKV